MLPCHSTPVTWVVGSFLPGCRPIWGTYIKRDPSLENYPHGNETRKLRDETLTQTQTLTHNLQNPRGIALKRTAEKPLTSDTCKVWCRGSAAPHKIPIRPPSPRAKTQPRAPKHPQKPLKTRPESPKAWALNLQAPHP